MDLYLNKTHKVMVNSIKNLIFLNFLLISYGYRIQKDQSSRLGEVTPKRGRSLTASFETGVCIATIFEKICG